MSDNILYNYKKKTNVTFSIFKDLLLTIFCIIILSSCVSMSQINPDLEGIINKKNLSFKFREYNSDIFVDVAITITLMVCFYGTYSGMVAGMLGGLCATITLFILKKTLVSDEPSIRAASSTSRGISSKQLFIIQILKGRVKAE